MKIVEFLFRFFLISKYKEIPVQTYSSAASEVCKPSCHHLSLKESLSITITLPRSHQRQIESSKDSAASRETNPAGKNNQARLHTPLLLRNSHKSPILIQTLTLIEFPKADLSNRYPSMDLEQRTMPTMADCYSDPLPEFLGEFNSEDGE